jgi:hypothetical protein
MRIKLLPLLLFAFVAVLTASVAGQQPTVPFHAKVIRIQEIFNQGGTFESEQTIQENYIRNSEGSTYQRFTGLAAGQPQSTIKVITNMARGLVYSVNEGKLTIVIHPILNRKSQQASYSSKLEKRTYLGRTCHVVRSSNQNIELWRDVELGITLYSRREKTLIDGRKMIRTTRVTDLVIGEEPDPQLFLPPSFERYTVRELPKP